MFPRAGSERSLITITTLVYFIVAIFYAMISYPAGDEPQYLLMSETLIKYHSLDIMKAYQHKDYFSFYPGALDMHGHLTRVQGRIQSIHQPGGPILWLIPFLLFGRLGAIWFIAAVSVFIVLNIYRLLLAMEIRQPIAFNVTLALALASPLCIYAHMNFVEPIGALVCVYILRKFIESDVSLSVLLLSSILLGLLPWVNLRFILIEIPLFFLLLGRLYQHSRLRNILSYLAYILPLALLTLGLEVFSWLFLGSLNPAISQMAYHPIFVLSPFAPLFGLLFDQDDGLLICFPLGAFLVAGLLLSAKKRYLTSNLAILFISVPYMIAVSTFIGWHGGLSPPARYVSLLLPVWSFYLAYVWQQVHGRFVERFVRATFWWGVVYNVWSLLSPTYGFIYPNDFTGTSKRNNVLAHLHIGNFYLADFWPSVPNAESNWNVAKGYHLIAVCNLIWIAAYLLLTLFLLHRARSNRDEPGEPTKLDQA